jgi:hypothetical protein
MLNYYQRLYIVNPHLFGSREVIDQHFRSGFPGKEYLGHHRNVESSITSTLAKINDLHYESIYLLNLCDHRDQRLYRVALKMCSESLPFLLQNGIFYKHSEIQEMITNGEFQKITGGATSVDLGHIFRI